MNFAKFLRRPLLQNTSGRLLPECNRLSNVIPSRITNFVLENYFPLISAIKCQLVLKNRWQLLECIFMQLISNHLRMATKDLSMFWLLRMGFDRGNMVCFVNIAGKLFIVARKRYYRVCEVVCVHECHYETCQI